MSCRVVVVDVGTEVYCIGVCDLDVVSKCMINLLLLSFVKQYVSKAASTVRSALKEPAKRQAQANEMYSFKRCDWENGVQGPKIQKGPGAPPKKGVGTQK